MKKLLFILSVIVLMSCEKPPQTYCWRCNKEVYAPHSYNSHILIICDKTPDEIRKYEDVQTTTVGDASIIMTCVRNN
jgi:hypothetical protein